MSRVHGRRDRTARLLSLQTLLWQYPDGLKIQEIAKRYNVSTKTIYRDLKSLEQELDVPIWEQGSKRGVVEGHFLPPINLSRTEAANIFLAVRLIQRFLHSYNPSVASVFMKLNTVVPAPLRQHIQKTIEYMEKLPKDERKIQNLNKLIEAWYSNRRVEIWYKGLRDKEPNPRIIEPYFIEPIVWTHSNHIIAYCHLFKSVRSFDIDRIAGEVVILSETYQIPKDFDAVDYFSEAWSIFQDQEIYDVKLRFESRFTEFIMENSWHPSQKVAIQEDGSLIMTLRTRSTIDFLAWILGWGNSVEVLEPQILRDQIASTAQMISEVYNKDFHDRKLKDPGFDRERIFANILPLDLTDEQWENIVLILPASARTGRPRADDRSTINGILWVLKTGKKWTDIPGRYGSHSTCHARFQAWKKQGIWDKIIETLNQR